MTEFKQIIGRGTRVFDGKDYFTIIDFTGATNLFYDPLWDGEAVVGEPDDEIDTPPTDLPPTSIDTPTNNIPDDEITPPKPKLRVKLSNNRELRIINVETRYIDETGKPMSATEYLESLIGKIPAVYHSEEQLRQLWADPKTREDLLVQLHNI